MTSHELAKLLLEGPDVMVTTRGYEGGVHEITTMWEPVPIHLNVREAGMEGPHELCVTDDQWDCGQCSYIRMCRDDDTFPPPPKTLAIHLS